LPSDGVAERGHQPPDLLKAAIYAGEQTGPYSGHKAGLVSGLDKIIAAHKRNRKESPGHYWLNPFVSGPISELLHRWQRRQQATAGSGVGGALMMDAAAPIGAAAGGVADLAVPGLGQAVSQGVSSGLPAAAGVIGDRV